MSTHNIGFYEDLTKIIFELSSNTHLISSAVTILFESFETESPSPFLMVEEVVFSRSCCSNF